MFNSAKLANLNTLKCELRKVLKLENYKTPFKVALFINIPSMQSINTDTF